MKKFVLLAALLVVAGVSFAFLPKADDPGGQMMLIVATTDMTDLLKITAIAPDGTAEGGKVPIDPKAKEPFAVLAHRAELTKLNELEQQGWYVSSFYLKSQVSMSVQHEVTYFLRRK